MILCLTAALSYEVSLSISSYGMDAVCSLPWGTPPHNVFSLPPVHNGPWYLARNAFQV